MASIWDIITKNKPPLNLGGIINSAAQNFKQGLGVYGDVGRNVQKSARSYQPANPLLRKVFNSPFVAGTPQQRQDRYNLNQYNTQVSKKYNVPKLGFTNPNQKKQFETTANPYEQERRLEFQKKFAEDTMNAVMNVSGGMGKPKTNLGKTGPKISPKKVKATTKQPPKTNPNTSPTTDLTVPPRVSNKGLTLTQQKQGARLQQSSKLKTKSPSAVPLNDIIPQNGYNVRGFSQQILDNPNIPAESKSLVNGLYKARNTKEFSIKAKNLVKADPDLALNISRNLNIHDDKGAFVASELIKDLQAKGQYELAIDISNTLAKRATDAGRFGQALSSYSKLTPDGVLRFAQREINKYNLQMNKSVTLDSAKAKILTEKAKRLQTMPDGKAKEQATALMLKEIYDLFPATWSQKVGTFQTMAQLLNPKTLIRNLGGNTIFGGLENISQTIAAPIDYTLSKVTGKRTTTLPSLGTQLGGFKTGLKEGTEEALKGINTGAASQFDLPNTPTFRGPVLGNAEKALNISLRATDRAAFTAAQTDVLRGFKKLNNGKVTPEMEDLAREMGEYRTFQDENMISNFFVGMKKTLNKIGFGQEGKRFGLGDLILKYPKTPGNLLARGVDYSPAGFAKSVLELGKPLIAGGKFNQKAFVDSLSRATVGTSGLVGTGYALGKLGIITEAPSKDKDIRSVQKTQGQGGYQINTSALKRYILSGFDPGEAKLKEGDTLVSYDWAQPAAISLSMGAKISNKGSRKESAGTALDSISGGVETLTEQPLVRGVKDFFGGQNPMDSLVINPAKSMPASFIPTALKQVRDITDNTARDTFDPSPVQTSINMVKNRIPVLAGSLPPRVDVYGNPQENYQAGSNSLVNVFLNPAFVSKYTPNNISEEVLRLQQSTGQTNQMPRVVGRNVTINGQKRELTPKEINEYQTFVGKRTVEKVGQFIESPDYQMMDDETRAKKLASLLTEINTEAKVALFGQEPKKTATPKTKTSKPKKISTKKSGTKKAKKGKKLKGFKPVKAKTSKLSLKGASTKTVKLSFTGLKGATKKSKSGLKLSKRGKV